MVDVPRRSALQGHVRPARLAVPDGAEPGVTLYEKRPSALAQIQGAPPESELAGRMAELGFDGEMRPRRAYSADSMAWLWNGPGRWLSVSRDHRPDELLRLLRHALEGSDATVTDLSHARTALTVTGSACRDLLAKGCPVDVDAMTPGDCAATLLGPFDVLVHCRDQRVFDVYVFRSFGLAMWEWLRDEALEFGCRIETGA